MKLSMIIILQTLAIVNSVNFANSPAHFEMHNLTVVDLTRDVGVFDYCDLSKYNPLDIQPLLRAHGIAGDRNNANYKVPHRSYILNVQRQQWRPEEKGSGLPGQGISTRARPRQI